MWRYIVRRLVLAIPVLLLVSVGTFLLIHLVPGNPAATILGEYASPKAIAALDLQLGLDRPLPVQFGVWLAALVHGNLGSSLVYSTPVSQMILARFPVTLELTVLSLGMSLALALPFGIAAGRRPNSLVDYVSRILSLAGVSMPIFWMALVLIYIFGLVLRVLPTEGFVPLSQGLGANLASLVLPAFAQALALMATTVRLLRSELMEALQQDFVRTARAKGVSERHVVTRHALRNALLPVVTAVGLQFGALLGGVVITETIFGLPGMGSLIVNSIFARDFPVVQGTVLVFALIVVVVNLLVDVTYAYIDPRIKYG